MGIDEQEARAQPLSDQDVDRVVRAIADFETELLNSDEIVVAGELFAQLVSLVPTDVRFDLLFRERRRFPVDRSDQNPDWLYFPYLSFSVAQGQLEHFTTPEAVQDILNLRSDADDYERLEQTKFILCVPVGGPSYAQRIARRCAKLVTAFYYASGPHDHFTANIARRHVTTYLAEHYNKDPEKLTEYIESIYDVQVAYVFQTTKDGGYETVVDKSNLLLTLNQYDEFQNDLRNAVRRKANFLGMTSDYEWHYSVHSLVDEASDLAPTTQGDSKPVRRLVRRGCAIVGRQGARLPLDVVKVVPLLFDAHRTATRAKDRDDFFREVQRSALTLEDELAARPPESIESFRGRVWNGLAEPLEQLLSREMMDWCQIFLADPFTPNLRSVLFRNAQGEIGADQGACYDLTADAHIPWVRAYSENKYQHVPNLDFVERDGLKDWGALFDSKTKSLFAAPLSVGRLRVGSVVIGSRWPHVFEAELPYLEAVTVGIGDFLHRMELVADISWLTRLSFLHSARHELENFRRRLSDGEDRQRFEEIVRTYSGMHASARPKGATSIADLVADCRARATRTEGTAKIEFLGDWTDVLIDEKDAAVVASILDQLLVNSSSHSNIGDDPFVLELHERQRGEGPVLALSYCSRAGRISEDLLPRVCVAPIPDPHSTTFHFGLFLCAVQARMLGGRASARQDVERAFKKAPLELMFELPLTIVAGVGR